MPEANETKSHPLVTVFLPGALTRLFPEARGTTELHAANVDDMLDALDARWPGMRDRLADTSPGIRRHINVFVDGERASLDTALDEGAKIYVLTAMSGG